jgi:hypothetical protein
VKKPGNSLSGAVFSKRARVSSTGAHGYCAPSAQRPGFRFEELQYRRAFGDAVAEPLPDLGAGEFGRGRVRDGDVPVRDVGALAARVGGVVAQGDGDGGAEPFGGGRGSEAAGAEQEGRCRFDVGAGAVALVGALAEGGGEGLVAGRDQSGVGDTGAVEAVFGLAFLVAADLGEGCGGGGG